MTSRVENSHHTPSLCVVLILVYWGGGAFYSRAGLVLSVKRTNFDGECVRCIKQVKQNIKSLFYITCQFCLSDLFKVLFQPAPACPSFLFPSKRNQMWDSPPRLLLVRILWWFASYFQSRTQGCISWQGCRICHNTGCAIILLCVNHLFSLPLEL